jgi:hypothetical protein
VLLVGMGVTVVHFVVTVISMMCLLWSAAAPANWVGRVLASLFFPLGFPANLIIGRWTEGLLGLSNSATFGLLFGSSALWGSAAALLWRWFLCRKQNVQANENA